MKIICPPLTVIRLSGLCWAVALTGRRGTHTYTRTDRDNVRSAEKGDGRVYVGERHVIVPDRRGRDAPDVEAGDGETELRELRRGLGFLEGADHGKSNPNSFINPLPLFKNLLLIRFPACGTCRVLRPRGEQTDRRTNGCILGRRG